MDYEGKRIACIYITLPEHHCDKFGTVVTILAFVGLAEGGIDETYDIISVCDVGIQHYINSFAYILILFFRDIQLDDLNFCFRKTLECAEVCAFGYKASDEGIVCIETSEGVHIMEVLVGGNGGMVELLFGENLQKSGQNGACLTENYINFSCFFCQFNSSFSHILKFYHIMTTFAIGGYIYKYRLFIV